jgi:hypothetical protein
VQNGRDEVVGRPPVTEMRREVVRVLRSHVGTRGREDDGGWRNGREVSVGREGGILVRVIGLEGCVESVPPLRETYPPRSDAPVGVHTEELVARPEVMPQECGKDDDVEDEKRAPSSREWPPAEGRRE